MATPTYTLYLDETGDHGLVKFRPHYPVLSLNAVLIEDKVYQSVVVPSVERFKVKWLGSANVPLHYSSIKKKTGPYEKFEDPELLFEFDQAVSALVASLPLTVLASVINKSEYTSEAAARPPLDPTWPENLYHVAVDFLIERFVAFLEQAEGKGSDFIAEARSPRADGQGKEDRALRLHYENRLDVPTRFFTRAQFIAVLPPTINFRVKADCVVGLELADMIAPQTATRTLRQSDDRLLTWQATKPKIWQRGDNLPGGVGLKTFPTSGTAREIMGVPLAENPS